MQLKTAFYKSWGEPSTCILASKRHLLNTTEIFNKKWSFIVILNPIAGAQHPFKQDLKASTETAFA